MKRKKYKSELNYVYLFMGIMDANVFHNKTIEKKHFPQLFKSMIFVSYYYININTNALSFQY